MLGRRSEGQFDHRHACDFVRTPQRQILEADPVSFCSKMIDLSPRIWMKRPPQYKLIGADGSVYASSIPGTLGCHRGSKIYGELDCYGALSWLRRGHYVKNRVFFASESDAIKAGYRPCGHCKRADYLE